MRKRQLMDLQDCRMDTIFFYILYYALYVTFIHDKLHLNADNRM